jgi:hypothetical protein
MTMTKLAIRLIALPLALVPLASLAEESKSDAVEKLKTSLPSTRGFEVDTMREVGDGVTCITYRVANDNGGESRAHAVVQGDEVQRSTTGNRQFEKAWNSKCAGSKS